jgi:hypothetical protein
MRYPLENPPISSKPKLSQYYGFDFNGTEICRLSGDQAQAQIISDSIGGAYITWEDARVGSLQEDIYIQRVDSNGSIQFPTNGIPICTADSWQKQPQMISDGSGGAIITWADDRIPPIGFISQTDIYTQRINSTGDVQWDANGTVICTAERFQQKPLLVSDETGGAIIAWQDYRTGSYDIYTQRINSTGDIQWDANGTAICLYSGYQYIEDIISDGAGGAIMVWLDTRDDFSERDIYAQKINSSGSVQWTIDGVKLSDVHVEQSYPQICSDGMGGAIITWMDNRSSSNKIYTQKINSTGGIQWGANGTSVSTRMTNQLIPSICTDEMGGAIIAWMDNRNEINYYDIYAQRINSTGNRQWNSNDNPILIADNNQALNHLISDGMGGALIAVTDDREELDSKNIYAQRIFSNGSVQSTLSGVAVCTVLDKYDKIANKWGAQLCSDGAEGAIFTWADHRNIGNNNDIYAQRLLNFTHIPSSSGQPLIPFGSVYIVFAFIGWFFLIILTNRKISSKAKR